MRGCRYLWSVELLGEMCKNIKLSKGYIYIYFENNSSRKRYNSFPPFKRSRTRRISSDIHTPECLLKILLGHLPVQNIFYLVNDFLLLTSTCCTSDSLPCFFFFFFFYLCSLALIINALIAIREIRCTSKTFITLKKLTFFSFLPFLLSVPVAYLDRFFLINRIKSRRNKNFG